MTTPHSHQEGIKYLRDEAIRAHLDGYGAKARHLSALALRSGATRFNLPTVQFKDLSWAFCLLIYWMLDVQDYSVVLEGAWRAFGQKQERGESSSSDDAGIRIVRRIDGPIVQRPVEHWATFVRFLLDVLGPDGLKWKDDIKLLEDIPLEFFQQEMDLHQTETLSIIICLVIEFMRYIYPGPVPETKDIVLWDALCKKWELYAGKTKHLENVQAALRITRNRLEKQHALVLNQSGFSYSANNALEKCWEAFYDLKTTEMKGLLTDLVKLVREDGDKFYPVQGLINMSRWMLELFADQFFGLYRIQRLYMENSQWLFNRLRKITFAETLNDARFKAEKGSAVGSYSAHLWRLSLLTELAALRNWDLGGYLEALRMQSQASIFFGLFPIDFQKKTSNECDSNSLREGILNAVKGCGLQDVKDRHFEDVRRALLNLELRNDAKSNIELIVHELVSSTRPVEYLGAVRVFSVLTDALSTSQMGDVFKISISRFMEKTIGYDMTLLNWWEDIFKWSELDRPIWDIADSILSDFFRSPALWRNNDSMMKEALIKAPMEIAEKWSENMLAHKGDVDSRQAGMPIIFNAALSRKELKKFAFRFLDLMKGDPNQMFEVEYNRLILDLDDERESLSRSETANKYRSALFDNYIKYAKSIASRKSKALLLGGGLNWQNYKRVPWAGMEMSDWKLFNASTVSAIQNPFILGGSSTRW